MDLSATCLKVVSHVRRDWHEMRSGNAVFCRTDWFARCARRSAQILLLKENYFTTCTGATFGVLPSLEEGTLISPLLIFAIVAGSLKVFGSPVIVQLWSHFG